MAYVDGFLLPVPKRNVQAYRRIAQKAGKVWREHGALEYRECVGDDLNVKGMGVTVPPPGQGQARRDGGLLLDRLQVARPSRQGQRQGDEGPADREDDEDPKAMPFDVKRMAYGGFKVLVDL